jgi:transketolase
MQGEAMAEATRAAFGRALARLGGNDPRLVVLDADLATSTQTRAFAEKYPERFIEVGIAEGNMIGIAAGLALAGKVPVAASFACFLAGRFEQIRMSVAYNRANVKLVGTHAGIGIGEDGYSQMATEDIALMRSLPNVAVIQPADGRETEQAVEYMLSHDGPVYLRLTRQKVEDVTPANCRFEFGRGRVLRDGSDLAIVASGAVVGPALRAATLLAEDGVDCAVLNIHTIKPLDSRLMQEWAGRVDRFLTVEDHSVDGGLGSAVCEAVAEASPVLVHRHGVREFGESGTAEALYRKHGLDAEGIVTKVRELLAHDAPMHSRKAPAAGRRTGIDA